MSKKLLSVCSLLVVMGLAGTVLAAAKKWTNANPSYDSWCEPGNWSPSGVPGSSDDVTIDWTSPDRGPVVAAGCNPDVRSVVGPDPNVGHTQVMDINMDGTFYVSSSWKWREGTGTAIININGSPTITIEGRWRGTDNGVSIINIDGDPTITVIPFTVHDGVRGADNAGEFYLNMSGGRLECGSHLLWGDNGGGELNLSGGTITTDELNAGALRGSAPVTLNMTGGRIGIRGIFRFPGAADRGGNTWMHLDGGVIDCNEFLHGGTDAENPTYTDEWRIDIEEGTLKIKGNVVDVIDANVAAGQITAYDGEGVVKVEFVDGNTVVTAIGPDPNRALEPFPGDLSVNVDPNVVLSWKPGVDAATHHIYLGTDFDDVNTADTSSGVYMTSQPVDNNSYDPNGPLPLKLATTYYWRIDEANGESVWNGRTWEFTTKRPIVDPNMRLWYKFDETSGRVASDSSGYGHDGGVYGPVTLWDPNDSHPHDGGSLIFDEDGEATTVVDVPRGVLEGIGGEVTIAVWLKDADRDMDNFVCDAGAGGQTGEHHLQVVYPTRQGHLTWRAGDDACDVLRWNLATAGGGRINPGALEGWHHWAFIKSESEDKMEIYFDGVLQVSKSHVAVTLANVRNTPFKIGSSNWENYEFVGAMDDFRVYDIALLPIEVAELFRGGDLAPAWAPKPFDQETDVTRDTDLAWSPGNWVVTHDLYFGTDFDDVHDADTSTAEIYKGPKSLGDESYEPGTLIFMQKYYWRIDEVNNADVNSPWKGNVWTFTVANFLVVDDMEGYDDDALVPTNPINETWIDGWWNNTGSTVYLEYGSGATVHNSAKSMWLEYNNNFGYPVENYSEIYANTAIGDKNLGFGRDWTADGMKALSLFFCGDPDNDIEPMYIVLEETSGANSVSNYGGQGHELSDITVAEWCQWDIALQDFNDGGVNIKDVNKVYIGLGDRDNPVAGGTGNLYIDDIRLYLPKCMPHLAKPAADLSNNCIVDLADLRMVAIEWLESDVNIAPVSPPGAPVLHYAFEDPCGSTITDSAGSYDGTFIDVNQTPGSIVTRIDSGRSGNSFHFATKLGYAAIMMPKEVFTDNSISQQITVAVWIQNAHPDERPDSTAFMWEFRQWDGLSTDANDRVLGVEVMYHGDKYVFHDSNESVTYEHEWNEHLGWEHYAFARDANNLKIYVNGELEVVADSNGSPMAVPDLLYLGMAADRAPGHAEGMHDGFTGNMDDFKIFNTALSAPEVAHVASDGTGWFCVESPGNLWDKESAGSGVVNLKDYAVLMDAWLEQVLWP